MSNVLFEIRKHIYIYFQFAKSCLIAQMEFRENFFIGLVIETAWLFAKILYVMVIYHADVDISGFSPDMVLIFIGTYTISSGIYMGVFFFNVIRIQQYVREGTLDLLIIKPVSLQFMVTLRYTDIGSPLPNFIGGIVMIVIGWHRVGIQVNLANISGFIGYIISGVFIIYAILFIPQMLSFWLVKTNSIFEIIDSLWNFNNMPMRIYTRCIQNIGTFILPIFLISNFPPLFVLGKLDNLFIVWGIIAPIIFMLITRLFWTMSVKNYSSASS